MTDHASSTILSSLDTHGTKNMVATAFTKYAEERNELLDAYFRETKLLDVVQACVEKLALSHKTQHALPANPYPSLLSEIRQAEVECAMAKSPSAANNVPQPQLLIREQQTSPSNRLCSTQELLALSVWGSRRVLETADVPQLVCTIRRLQELNPLWFRDSDESEDDDGCKVAVHSALVGNCIDFALSDHSIVELERHIVITGEYLEMDMEVFARQLQKCLYELSSGSMNATTEPTKRCIGCTGICIMTEPSPNRETQNDDATWPLVRIAANRNAFVSAIKNALVDQSSIEITTRDLLAAIPETDSNGGKSRNRTTLLQTTQRFFLYFASTGGTATNAKSSTKKQQQAPPNCVFSPGQSRVSERGVFLSERGALEISTRLQQQQENGSNEQSNSATTGSEGGDTADPRLLLKNMVVEIKTLAGNKLPQSPSVSWRRRMETFIDSYAFSIIQVTMRNHVLAQAMPFFDPNLADDVAEAHFAVTNSLMQTLLEQARVGARSSLLTSVEAVLRTRWQELQDQLHQGPRGDIESDLTFDTTVFADALTSVSELLQLVAHAAAADFTCFLRRSQDSSSSGLHMKTEKQIDVIVALQNAIDNREYPPLVVFETVFAQYLVDSRVDIALESAVMNIVAFHLPPNPRVELSQRARAFAIRHHVPRMSLRAAGLTANTTTTVDHLVSMMRSENTSSRPFFSSNSRLLEILDADKLCGAHQWLMDNCVIRESNDFQPSKSSYSLQTFHSFLVFHPIVHHASTLGALSPPTEPITTFHLLIEKLEVVEHVVVEGKELTQAFEFFSAAVVNDLKWLTDVAAAHAVAPSKVTILDLNGKRISDVKVVGSENNEDAMRIQQLVQGVTPAKCVLRISSVCCNPPTRRSWEIVSLPFQTYHRFSRGTAEMLLRVAAFRLLRFGVFFSSHHAQFVLSSLVANKGVDIPGDNGNFQNHMPIEDWTPCARDATDHDDLLLQYELDCATPTDSTAAADQVFRQYLVAQSCLLQLFSIEATCTLALEQLGHEINTTRREPSIPTLRGIDSSIAPSFSRAFSSFIPMLVDQLQQILVPLNDDMKYVEEDDVAGHIVVLQRLVNGDDTKRFHKALRCTWLLVLYVRFSYQRDFFAHFPQQSVRQANK
ncbi:hypothetical protein FI667_g15000, partial [Globisporangium splendens]